MGEIKGTTFPKKKKKILNFNKQEILIKASVGQRKIKVGGKKKQNQKNQLSILIGFDMLHKLLFFLTQETMNRERKNLLKSLEFTQFYP